MSPKSQPGDPPPDKPSENREFCIIDDAGNATDADLHAEMLPELRGLAHYPPPAEDDDYDDLSDLDDIDDMLGA